MNTNLNQHIIDSKMYFRNINTKKWNILTLKDCLNYFFQYICVLKYFTASMITKFRQDWQDCMIILFCGNQKWGKLFHV